MRSLGIHAEIGPAAPIDSVARVVSGIRTAVAVAREADTRRIRRVVGAEMRFPSERDLDKWWEALPEDDDLEVRHRLELLRKRRRQLRKEFRHFFPPDLWYEWLEPDSPRREKLEAMIAKAGIEHWEFGALVGGAAFGGLERADPSLYQALVSNEMAARLPSEIRVHELRYKNPLFAKIFGKGTAEQTISTTAQVIETVSTLGSTRKMAKAAADVAEQTVTQQVEGGELDLRLKRLAIEQREQELLAAKIANAKAAEGLATDRLCRQMVEQALRRGQLDIADAIRALNADEVGALNELGQRLVELEEHNQSRPDESRDA